MLIHSISQPDAQLQNSRVGLGFNQQAVAEVGEPRDANVWMPTQLG
ncbi:hypothetical protein RISK_001340 [Rhodopirellula islandica]|uniref:Uncharacterized protein n=1 Tax=Rhodopirellula islandica TaxID=595434 RepID=A0A0J1BJ62_RHOIS|nr:hypothetical protein RISK_001340 [Rhodopirellula islandica]